MKTRRKSARKAAEAEAEQEAGSSVVEDLPPSPSQSVSKTISLTIPSDISLEDLSNLVPDTVLDSPTPQTILYVYKLVLAQAGDLSNAIKELEDARAQIVRKDVELDQALQDKEVAVSELEQSVQSIQKELETAMRQRDELSTSQATLQSQVSTLSNTQSTRSSELDVLQRRVEDTEREKRDLVVVVDRLRADSTQSEEEIKSLKENLKKIRTEHSDIQSELRNATSTQTTNKFRIESLELQLELATQERERNSVELDAKIEEFAKYRREKQAQHIELQSSFDTLSHEHDSCKAELENLKHAYQTQQHQLTTTLEKVNTLQDQLAEESAASRAQAETQARLIELLEKRHAEGKRRVQDVDNEWDRMMQEHSDAEKRLQDQLRREKERADRLDANLTRVLEGSDTARAPSTPTPEPSSSANIVASFMKGTKLSDIFDENRRVKEELQKVKAENVRLADTTTQLISKVQEMAPQLGEQRVEYERQKSEAIQLSHQLSIVLSERDHNLQQVRDFERKLETSQKENGILNSQLSDLGRQVQVLLREVSINENPSLASVEQEDDAPEAGDGIDSLISSQLVIFKNIPAFQEQYTKHLKIIRELGDKLERVTREQYEEQSRLETQALEEASIAVAELQEELFNQKRAHDIEIRGYIQERDMYKARLSSQSQAKSIYGMGINGDIEPPRGDPEYEALLVDLQRNFDVYRTETGVDMAKLRDELQESQKEAAQLQAALAKANAKVEFHNERHAMLNDSYTRQQTEISSLRRRSEDMLNQAHRVEAASHQISEQLAVANSTIERLRHEAATLSAEKLLWKNVETRLVEENQHLSKEKAQLSDVISNVNKMHHELERTVDSEHRRLERQAQILESQTQELRSQLAKERELVRHVTLQKDVETKELQSRVDDATRELSGTRESLVAAETSQTHLQRRVDDLSKQLEANLEKLSVYERRPGATVSGVDQASREEHLEAEVAELKGTLKMTQVDLGASQEHVEQFRNIARASEEAFEKVNEALNDHKRTAEAEISQKESELQTLQEKLRTVEMEVSSLSSKHVELRQSLDSERQTFANDKRTLEETIIDMTNSAANIKLDEAERASLLKIQEERATVAEERYQREIVSHAESIKSVEELRQQLANVQTLVREKQAAAETAQSMLATAEASWKSQREVLDKEMADINARCRDLSNQNAILHQHLESVNTQATRIRQVVDEPNAGNTSDTQQGVDDATSELRSVVAYLRREKEIVDLQLELNKQENLRLKAQVDHLSRALEESRTALSEERERAAESVTSATQYAELLERINQLNLLRESNATLRTEVETYRKQSDGLETKLRELVADVEPVKEEVRTLRAEVESRDQQLERVGRECQQWKERSQQILSKYDRIDPAEMQQLKEKLEKLEIEKTDWEQTKSSLESQVAQTERYKENLVNFRKQYAALSKDSKEKLSAFETERKELQSERDALKNQLLTNTDSSQQVTALSARIDALTAEKSQLEASSAQEKTRLEEAIETQKAKIADLSQQGGAVGVAGSTDGGDAAKIDAAVEEAKREWEAQRIQLNKEREEAAERETSAKTQKLAEDKSRLEALIKRLQQRLADEVNKQREQQTTPAPDVEELVRARIADATAQQTRDHEAAIQSAVEAATTKLRQELESSSNRADGSEADMITSGRHQEELKTLESRLGEKHAEELKAAVQSALESIPKQDPPVADVEALVKERIETALKEQEQKLTATHAQELKTATENGRKEINTKFAIKESQLVKAVAAKKELEEKIKALESRIASPSGASTKAASSADASTPGKTPSIVTRKASLSTAATPTSPAAASLSPTQTLRGAARGRGRGVAIRGGAAGRGSVLANVNSAAAASSSGTSILGAAAAAKRPAESSPPESPALAKRLRSAPITIQRNRVPPSDGT